MNRPQRAMLRGMGAFLFVLALGFDIVVMSQSQDIRMADGICNAKFDVAGYMVEVGQFAQRVLDYEGDCYKIHFLRLGVDYSWIVLVAGIVLYLVGVWAGLGAKGKKEMVG